MTTFMAAHIDSDPSKVIIDLGYLGVARKGFAAPTDLSETNPETEARYKALAAAGLGKRCFVFGPCTRLMAVVPQRKRKKILAAFPAVKKVVRYFGATHTWT